MGTTTYSTTTETLRESTIQRYRTEGFVPAHGLVTPNKTSAFREAALTLSEHMRSFNESVPFIQLVNAWGEDATIRRLTMHPNVAGIAERLAGVPLRRWHDQVLIKQSHNQHPTLYMDARATYRGQPHPIAGPLPPKEGQVPEG